MALRDMMILMAEMDRELRLASASSQSARDKLQVACTKGTPEEIEAARVRCVETYSAFVDLTIKWSKKINDMRSSHG